MGILSPESTPEQDAAYLLSTEASTQRIKDAIAQQKKDIAEKANSDTLPE